MGCTRCYGEDEGRVFDVLGGVLTEEKDILIEGIRIKAVGRIATFCGSR